MSKTIIVLLVGFSMLFVGLLAGIRASDDLYECYSVAIERTNEIRVNGESNYWPQRRVCEEGREVHDRYEACVETKLEWDGLAREWVEWIGRAIEPSMQEVSEIFSEHNELCSRYSDYVIPESSFSFGL